MWSKIKRPFIIKTKIEASFIVYALALGAAERGKDYLDRFPGNFGWVMFSACMLAVLMGGAKIFDAISLAKAAEAS
jgi:hypothetical protein